MARIEQGGGAGGAAAGLAAVATTGAYADLTGKPAIPATQGVQTTSTTTGDALVINAHNPVDATGGAKTKTLPTGQSQGTAISVEKEDATANAVTVTGSIRGVGSASVALVWQYESITLIADSAGSWWPRAGHKTKASLDAVYGPYTAPRQVIWDSDWYTDVDDVVAARVLGYYERIGKVDVLASIINTTAASGAPSMDAFWRAEGRPMQLGQVGTYYSDLSAGGPYQANMATNTPHYGAATTDFPSAVTVYRTALAQAANNSVDIISVGYLAALWALLISPADTISALTGAQLIAAKVRKLWLCGGAWPSGSENNFTRSTLAASAANYVVTNWPAPTGWTTAAAPYITFLGFEVGNTVNSGGTLSTLVPSTDVVYKAMVDYGLPTGGHSSWDPMLTQLACIGDETAAGYTTVRGTATVASAGTNSFATSATGPHQYVVKANSDASYAASIDAVLIPGRQPIPDDTAKRAWSRPRGGIIAPIAAPAVSTAPVLIAEFTASSLAGTADGTAVATAPASKGARSWVQATGSAQPIYRTSIGGKACIQFSGAQALATTAKLTAGTTGVTALALVYWTTLPTSNQSVIAADAGGTARWFHLAGVSGANVSAAGFVGNTGTGDTEPGLIVNTWQVIALRMDPAASVEALLGTATNGVTAISGANTGNFDIHLGASLLSGFTEPLNNGYIAHAQVYDGRASDAQLATMVAAM